MSRARRLTGASRATALLLAASGPCSANETGFGCRRPAVNLSVTSESYFVITKFRKLPPMAAIRRPRACPILFGGDARDSRIGEIELPARAAGTIVGVR